MTIPRTDVLTLEEPVSLVFEGPTQELVVVILPLDISRVEIGIELPNPMIGLLQIKESHFSGGKEETGLPQLLKVSGEGEANLSGKL